MYNLKKMQRAIQLTFKQTGLFVGNIEDVLETLEIMMP